MADASVVDLLRQLSRDLRSLAEQAVALVSFELRESGHRLGVALGGLVVAALALVAGAAVLLAAAVLGLVAAGLPAWAAAATVGAVLALAGGAGGWWALGRLRDEPLRLPHTRRALRETRAWLSAELH
jgi:uncharacterized membrane protein YqjE